MIAKFRHYYPQGSIVSELIDLDRGLYLVKVTIQVSGIILATGLAAAERVELAEDRARERAIALLALDAVPVNQRAKKIDTVNVGNSKPPSSDEETASPEVINKTHGLEEDYVTKEQSKFQQPDLGSSEAFPSATTTPESSSASSIEETPEATPVVENGNLFAGTLESQSPAETNAQNFEPLLETFAEQSEPDLPANKTIEVNFDDIKHQTDIHIKRLGWTKEDGVNFLKSRYGKRSRLHLKDEELLEFLQYLENQPTPQ